MVAFSLRPHVIASWNSYCFKESQIAGLEVKEIMVEDWLSLSNGQVQEILVESARPRMRELYSRELVLFLGKGIPQTPTINPENFSSTFYAPLMKSLNDLLHLHDLLSEETSNHNNNKSKMPVPGYPDGSSTIVFDKGLLDTGAGHHYQFIETHRSCCSTRRRTTPLHTT